MSTITVQLKYDWFAPREAVKITRGEVNIARGGHLRRGKNGPEKGIHVLPAELESILPESAEVIARNGVPVDGGAAPEPARDEDEDQSFKDMDPLRQASDELADKLYGEQEEVDLAARQAEFKAQLEAEKAAEAKPAPKKARVKRR